MGAVVDGTAPIIVRNEEVIELSGTSAREFEDACASELAEIERRRQLYVAAFHLTCARNKRMPGSFHRGILVVVLLQHRPTLWSGGTEGGNRVRPTDDHPNWTKRYP
jgi:hypothetical protein